jgi:hypothetical protein
MSELRRPFLHLAAKRLDSRSRELNWYSTWIPNLRTAAKLQSELEELYHDERIYGPHCDVQTGCSFYSTSPPPPL